MFANPSPSPPPSPYSTHPTLPSSQSSIAPTSNYPFLRLVFHTLIIDDENECWHSTLGYVRYRQHHQSSPMGNHKGQMKDDTCRGWPTDRNVGRCRGCRCRVSRPWPRCRPQLNIVPASSTLMTNAACLSSRQMTWTAPISARWTQRPSLPQHKCYYTYHPIL